MTEETNACFSFQRMRKNRSLLLILLLLANQVAAQPLDPIQQEFPILIIVVLAIPLAGLLAFGSHRLLFRRNPVNQREKGGEG